MPLRVIIILRRHRFIEPGPVADDEVPSDVRRRFVEQGPAADDEVLPDIRRRSIERGPAVEGVPSDIAFALRRAPTWVEVEK